MHILALAPYPALLPLIEEVASDFPDLEVTPARGNLDEALISALTVFHKDFDAVISRGGTAESLEEEFSLPIIAIGVSPFDIARCVRETGAESGRIAAIGFPNILAGIPETASLLELNIECFPIDFEDEIEDVLDRVAQAGFDALIGDTVSTAAAQARGLPMTLISSGRESVRDAFERARLVLANARKVSEGAQLLRDIIRLQGVRLAVYAGDAELTYTTLGAQDASLLDDLARYTREDVPPERFLFRHGGTLYTVRSLVNHHEGRRQVAFTITSESVPGRDRQTGISYLARPEIESSYRSSTFCILDAGTELEPALRRMGSTGRPLFISGETGSGKPRVAQLLYLLSPYAGQPYIEINCDIIDDRAWEFLISDHRSPLFESGAFLVFRSLHMLPAPWGKALLGTIHSTRLADRCKLVFSFNLLNSGEEPEIAVRFAELLDGFSVTVPPLRKLRMTEDAPERYLAALARRDNVAPPVLDAEAVEILSSYHWPRNILQFKQVMNWAFAASQGGVITTADIRDALSRESSVLFSSASTPDAASMIDVLKPLSETSAEIARMVVASYGGNRTVAAKTLGISRTTLWTMLKRLDSRGA